jgi:hypothetical protein
MRRGSLDGAKMKERGGEHADKNKEEEVSMRRRGRKRRCGKGEN